MLDFRLTLTTFVFVCVTGLAQEPPASTTAPELNVTPDAHGSISQSQIEQLFRVVGQKDRENHKRQRDYTYVERQVENRIDAKGNIKATEVKTYEVLNIYGDQVERLIEKNDKPLSKRDAAREEEKIQKIIDKRNNESEGDRRKRAGREEKEREDSRKFATEVADAYNFKLVGTEWIGRRAAWVIDAEPRRGFVPHTREARLLLKFHGRVWIDKADLQLAKMDVECLDTISFGLFLARFHKGSRLILEQARVNDEVWLPAHLAAKADVRLGLIKNFDVNLEQTFRGYKKFQSSSKVIASGEVHDQN